MVSYVMYVDTEKTVGGETLQGNDFKKGVKLHMYDIHFTCLVHITLFPININ